VVVDDSRLNQARRCGSNHRPEKERLQTGATSARRAGSHDRRLRFRRRINHENQPVRHQFQPVRRRILFRVPQARGPPAGACGMNEERDWPGTTPAAGRKMAKQWHKEIGAPASGIGIRLANMS
jgi:hypothetical protein